MQQADTLWFKSKVDGWMGVVIVALPVTQVGSAIYAISIGDSEGLIASLVGLAVIAAIYGLVVAPVRYGITDDALLVHFGVIRQRIRFDAIREVYPTRALWSSPALSLDRLAVTTGRGPFNLTLISPERRDEFLALLSARGDLRWDGKRWVRG